MSTTGSRPPLAAGTAAALIIGNEILTGKTTDENSPLLARELRAIGIDLRHIAVVPDEIEVISSHLRELSARHDLVFTSGGVGPTHDDVTFAAVAHAFVRPLVRNPELEATIRAHYSGAPPPASLHMADLPAGAELVPGEGLWVPAVRVENVWILPGVPAIFRAKVVALRAHLSGRPVHLREVVVMADEACIADCLSQVVKEHPQVSIGSYPEPWLERHRVKVTLESRDAGGLEVALAELLRLLPPEMLR